VKLDELFFRDTGDTVQTIHILGDQAQQFTAFFKLADGKMCNIGLDVLIES
jgi:hypothetical protein